MKRTLEQQSHPVKMPFSFKHQVMPPLLGVLMMVSVLGLLNIQWIVAQYNYRFMSRQTVSATEVNTESPDPQAGPQILIPSINVKAPVVMNEHSTDATDVQLALRRGTLHYGQSSFPGEKGNVVIIGHSSGAAWRPGEYKFVFTLLDKLRLQDKIIVDYDGTRYVYQVTDAAVVSPSDVSVLAQDGTSKLTLITCTPVGTNKYRLIVHAKQISPNPSTLRDMPRFTDPSFVEHLPE